MKNLTSKPLEHTGVVRALLENINIIQVHLHVWIVMTTYGMVTKMHDEGVSSYYKPFSLTTRGAGDVHATIIDSPPPRDMFNKNMQRRK